MAPVDDPDIQRLERELQQWLVSRAERGVPETVLVHLLWAHAGKIERLGYVPRAWRSSIAGREEA